MGTKKPKQKSKHDIFYSKLALRPTETTLLQSHSEG